MYGIVTLDVARAYMRVGSETTDTALLLMIDAATALVQGYLGYPILKPAGATDGWPTPNDVPASIIVAICIVALDIYDDRDTPLTEIEAVRALAGSYRRHSF